MSRPDVGSSDAAPLTAVEGLLECWLGLDPGTIGSAAIQRAVRIRMTALEIDELEAYVDVAEQDRAERDRLVEEVIVPESWFFRDRQVFDFVRGFATTVAALPGRGPLRILSAPCAGGEEPYSVAMALLEAGLGPARFIIDAVDVSRKALGRAERGVYSANAFRNADLSFRDRWFRGEDGGFVIDTAVRQCVRFHWGNIVDRGFAEGLGGTAATYDVIFCRNLLIYLTAEARDRVEKNVGRLLAADGLLVVGAAEPPTLQGRWIPAADSSIFALKRGPQGGGPLAVPKAAATAAGRPRPVPAPLTAAVGPASASIVEATAGPATGHLPLDEVVRQAGSLANDQRFVEALTCCQQHLSHFGPSAEVFFLMGMIQQSAGDADQAEGCFHKTLYLDPDHEDALLALSLSASRRGDAATASRFRQAAARASARKAAS
jgi:chemotaxis protein methyltransferase WspC